MREVVVVSEQVEAFLDRFERARHVFEGEAADGGGDVRRDGRVEEGGGGSDRIAYLVPMLAEAREELLCWTREGGVAF